MKRLIFSIVIALFLVSCGVFKSVYREYRTSEPMYIIDSIARSNRYLDSDTTLWRKSIQLNAADSSVIKSWYQSWSYKQRVGSMVLIQHPDGEYLLKYKVE